MTRTFTQNGKQVLVNGSGDVPGFHVADCITEEMARRVAEALNARDRQPIARIIGDQPAAVIRIPHSQGDAEPLPKTFPDGAGHAG